MTDSTPAQGSPEAEARAFLRRAIMERRWDFPVEDALDAYRDAIRKDAEERIKALEAGITSFLEGEVEFLNTMSPGSFTSIADLQGLALDGSRLDALLRALLAEDAARVAPVHRAVVTRTVRPEITFPGEVHDHPDTSKEA